MSTTCCTQDCRQGRDCPLRKQHALSHYSGMLAQAAAEAPTTGAAKAEQLTAILQTLTKANDKGLITDTIWHGPGETLFDFIQNAIDGQTAQVADLAGATQP